MTDNIKLPPISDDFTDLAHYNPNTDDIERMAVNRYRPVPSGVLAYKVVGGDGDRSLFSGTKDECQIVARKLTEAFLDGAHSAITAQAQEAAPAAQGEPSDTERLDFLVDNLAMVVSDPECADGYWLVFDDAYPQGTKGVQVGEYPTAREAIDAALAAQQKGET